MLFFEGKTYIEMTGKKRITGMGLFSRLLKKLFFSCELEFGPFKRSAFQWEKFLKLADQWIGLFGGRLSEGVQKEEIEWKWMENDWKSMEKRENG